ncbi:MAG: hypothetical protein ACREHG_01845 [Candidatus Saccharimonadales bacterium]
MKYTITIELAQKEPLSSQTKRVLIEAVQDVLERATEVNPQSCTVCIQREPKV